jgi:hypothetical protein
MGAPLSRTAKGRTCQGTDKEVCAPTIRMRQLGNQRHPDGQLAFRRLKDRLSDQIGAVA